MDSGRLLYIHFEEFDCLFCIQFRVPIRNRFNNHAENN